MKITHTSPTEITKITPFHLFEGSLFFSTNGYTMTQSNVIYTYSMDIDEEEITDQFELYDEEIITEISEELNISVEDAERVLDGRDSAILDHFSTAEQDWWIQAKQAECAKKMGFVGVESVDENGTVYIINMIGKESELNLISVEGA